MKPQQRLNQFVTTLYTKDVLGNDTPGCTYFDYSACEEAVKSWDADFRRTKLSDAGEINDVIYRLGWNLGGVSSIALKQRFKRWSVGDFDDTKYF